MDGEGSVRRARRLAMLCTGLGMGAMMLAPLARPACATPTTGMSRSARRDRHSAEAPRWLDDRHAVVYRPQRALDSPQPVTVLLHGLCGDPAGVRPFVDASTARGWLVCPSGEDLCGGGARWRLRPEDDTRRVEESLGALARERARAGRRDRAARPRRLLARGHRGRTDRAKRGRTARTLRGARRHCVAGAPGRGAPEEGRGQARRPRGGRPRHRRASLCERTRGSSTSGRRHAIRQPRRVRPRLSRRHGGAYARADGLGGRRDERIVRAAPSTRLDPPGHLEEQLFPERIVPIPVDVLVGRRGIRTAFRC